MTTHATPPTLSAEPRSAFDIANCFSDAMEVYRRNFWLLTAAWIVTDILILFSLFILIGPLMGGWVVLSMRAMQSDDKRIDFGDLFRAFNRFGPLVGLFFACTIPIVIGSFLLVVPGMLLATAWMFTYPLVVDQRMPVFKSFGSSWRMVRRHGFGRLFGFQLILFLLTIPTFIPYLGIVLAWLILPFTTLVWMAAYRQCMDGQTCLDCDYDLRGGPDVEMARCPECGRPIGALGDGCGLNNPITNDPALH